MKEQEQKIKIAATSDIHIKENTENHFTELFRKMSQESDVMVICGDITDVGKMEEAQIVVNELSVVQIPIVAVLGNHDFESDKNIEITDLFVRNRIHVLQGTEFIFEKEGRKVGFTGVKGFGGGFVPYMWGRFGEPEQKAFYDANVTQVQDLENGISKLQEMDDLIARFILLHFAPIRDTVVGDIVEMYPFLGSTRYEEVIDRYENITGVIHGHSHHGAATGKTARGIPVYNVAYPRMQKEHPEKPYLVLEV